MKKCHRKTHSIKKDLVSKSQESALSAIQIYNNPLIHFKSEIFIVLMIIAWTYLLHAYYRNKKIDYRHKQNKNRYARTKNGNYKYWELEHCLDQKMCSLDKPIKDNLKFLIGIRHEIEHQMTNAIDMYISGKFQACCINYNETLKKYFPKETSLDEISPIALQLFSFTETQVNSLKNKPSLPSNILNFISDYEAKISTKNDQKYSYRVIYLREKVNHENQADCVYKFIDELSPEGKEIHNILTIKGTDEPAKFRPTEIVDKMKKLGFVNFNLHHHTKCWKDKEAKNPSKKYGVNISGSWYWYDKWLNEV